MLYKVKSNSKNIKVKLGVGSLGSESKAHSLLKDFAKILLLKVGFKPEEIHCEFQTRLDGKRFVVDVAGIKEDYKVAIECGDTDSIKLIALRNGFSKILHLSYEYAVEFLLGQTTTEKETRSMKIPSLMNREDVLVFRESGDFKASRVFPYEAVAERLKEGNMSIVADISRQTASAATKILRRRLNSADIHHTTIKLEGKAAYLYFKS